MNGGGAVLSVEGLTIGLPPGADRALAVRDASFSVRAGETFCLVGESGSGKSLTAFAVARLLPPHLPVLAGRVLLQGRDVLGMRERDVRPLRGRVVSMVFQEPMTALNPVMTIGSQLGEPFAAHLPAGARPSRSDLAAMLAEVGLPAPDRVLDAHPASLSGGQRQRVMIAIAVALKPALLIADEPTTALDVSTQAQILALLKRMQAATGAAIVFITHDFGVVADIADSVGVMRDGVLVETGPRDEVLMRPRHAYTRELISLVPRLAHRRQPLARGSPLMTADGVSKIYRQGGILWGGTDVPALRGVDLQVMRGETLGIIGESGSGKSTLARCLVGLERPTAGRVTLDGEEVGRGAGRAGRAMRRRIQMVFQDPFASLNPRRRVGDAVARGLIAHGEAAGPARARATELLALVGLEPSAGERYPHEFSGGQRQRIGIARALALGPELLVADEAVSALDVSVQAQILELLRGLKERMGLTLVLITHDLRIASQVCDRLVVMHEGRVVEQGPTWGVIHESGSPYTRGLLAALPGRGWEALRPGAPA